MSQHSHWTCLKCGERHESQFDGCWNCGTLRGDSKPIPGEAPKPEVTIQSNSKTKFNHVILTTAPTIEGYNISETLEIVTSECVYGLNLFSDFFASMTDTFGGRSETTQNALRDARKTCLSELKREAGEIGADAVIAVDLDYSEFSGKGKSMLFLVASGTAVKLSKNLQQI